MPQERHSDIEERAHKLSKIRQLIEQYFMYDWAISIEYALTAEQDTAQWTPWKKKFFALRGDVSPVLETIIDCCTSNPNCSMKLICEHFNPDYRFVVCLRSLGDELPDLAA